ncbi:hypothetical protein EDC04DRAFT_2613503 [Pisolithus marmoratus]|nr:hypothetical protein EDC04DRAFT_2613503 [Pisolithus marmoratus]
MVGVLKVLLAMRVARCTGAEVSFFSKLETFAAKRPFCQPPSTKPMRADNPPFRTTATSTGHLSQLTIGIAFTSTTIYSSRKLHLELCHCNSYWCTVELPSTQIPEGNQIVSEWNMYSCLKVQSKLMNVSGPNWIEEWYKKHRD